MPEITSLSVLIPVYNCLVSDFVKELSRQGISLNIPFEILCFDDGSDARYKESNRIVMTYPSVRYKEMEKNFGRAAIRNILASEANGRFLLFLDCDGKINDRNFLKNYLSADFAPVIVGGRTYSLIPPEDTSYILHWKAGSAKEVTTAKTRQEHPYQNLMFNNILVEKDLFLNILLDETIKGYGHEDTLFGAELEKRNIKITHINNPVDHLFLETSEEFIIKTRNAVRNLAQLIKNHNAGKESKLYKTYHTIDKVKLSMGTSLILKALFPLFKRNLLSSCPSLIYLDLVKLYWFMSEMKSEEKVDGTKINLM